MVPLGDIIREEYESMPEPVEGEPTMERLEKRQKYLKEEIEEIKMLIQEAIDKRGGLQPQSKLAVVNEPDDEDEGPELTEIGKTLAKTVAQEKEIDRNEVQEFFAKRGFPRSKSTVLNKMKQISGAQDQIKFQNDGGRGTGGNQPSKLINKTAF
ncbi:MAG: hypothetical protein ABEJ83_01885 [Candidatus Nanohaloarchaea archaeon]